MPVQPPCRVGAFPDSFGAMASCRNRRSYAGSTVSGRGQAEARRQTTLAGFDQHLVKPVAPALIASVLEELAAG